MALLALSFTLFACNSLNTRAAEDLADEQISSGTVTMPTSENRAVLGDEGMMYLYCAGADGGCYGTDALVFAGTSPNFPLNWDPATSDLAFGTYTTDDGSMAFVTQFPYPSSGRGDAATPDAVNVDWETGEGSDLGEEGLNDGWYNLVEGENVGWVSDCGHYHLNIFFDWESDGSRGDSSNAATYGEDFCDQADTGE